MGRRPGVVLTGVLVVLVAVVAGVVQLVGLQNVRDRWDAHQFHPAARMAALVPTLELTGKGRRYLYASRAQVSEAATFNKACPTGDKTFTVIGCYTNRRIYVYDVTDPQLAGIQQVTADHEMLHAAWDRLSASEHAKLGKELTAAYDRLDDPDLKDRMAGYQKNEPGQFTNELHSILGTEYADLGPDLERYYAQYFTDRASVVADAAQYTAQFVTRQKQYDALGTELTQLGMSIDGQNTTYTQQRVAYDAAVDAFNAKAAAPGGFPTQEEFASARAQLVAQGKQLDVLAAKINADVATYNDEVKTYNDLATQLQKLHDSLDSRSGVQAPASTAA